MKNKRTGKRVVISVLIVVVWAALGLMTGTRRVSATTFLVTDLGDNGGVNPAPGAGTGTLRQAIIDANAAAGADTITFQAGGTSTITLAAALPVITDSLTILGPGANLLTVSAPSGTTTIRIFDITGAITASVSGLTMANGNVTGLGGTDDHGGIIRITNATVTLTNCSVLNGRAAQGAGIEVNPGNLTLNACTVAGNITTISVGGGLLVFGPATLSITNSTFSGNHSMTSGGAIGLANGVTATIASSTLTANTATGVGGIITLSTLTIKSTIIAGNTGATPDVNQFTSAGSNLIGDNTGTTITNQMPSDLVGTGAGPIDPMLGPLADNGGPTHTHALLSGSPAIDAVTDCTDVAMNPITEDQRGAPRPIDGDSNGTALCDIGAFEAPLCTTDTQPPSITCPANITVQNDPNQCSAVVNYTTPTATDNCLGETTVNCLPASGSAFAVGTTTVTCTATDASGNTASCSFTITVNDTQAPTITCPANITVSTAPNQCSAVVSYTVPTATDICSSATVACLPASGSTFPKGTTTVTCTATDSSNNFSSCAFTVTVNDTQPPTITCPANVTAVAAQTCPISSSATVTFPAPTASDNCPGVTVACNPPSGSTLPIGTTTVTCTATDASGNTATCSFTVTVFSGCLQDDSNPANVVLFNAATGEYRFCCGGTAFTGVGTVLVKGCTLTIQHYPADRRVLIKFDGAVGAGSASLQSPPGSIKCTVADRNTRNNTCACQ